MRNTKLLLGLIFLIGIIFISGITIAITTVNDNSVTVSSGNVTADWFIGKVNISSIQNFQYNYNQTTASGDGSFNSTYASFAYNQTTAAQSYADSITNRTFNKSATDLYYSSIIWGYNQSSALQSQYGQFWYNQTVASQTTTNPFNQNLNTTSESSLGALNVSVTTSSGDRSPALNIVSRNQNQSAVWITGNESDKGTLKITHTGYVEDGTSAGISIDLQGTGTSSKGIFITSTTGGTSGNYLHVSNGSSNLYTLDNYQSRTFLQTHITYLNDSAFLVEKTDGTDIFKIDTISDLLFTGTLRPRSNLTQDVGQPSILYRGAYFDQNVTARYFKGDGSLLTNLPASSGGYNVTYDATSQDVTANRSIWGTNHSSVLISQFGTFWYNLTSPAITYANTKAATGNCAAGFVVQNTTTSGVQCVPASTSTTNDGITINGANITAGTIALARLPSLTDTHTLNIANITSFIYNYNQTSLANTYTDGRGFITNTNVAYTNISNNFARSQNVSGNVTIRSGDNVCLDGDACTKKIFYNGSNIIIQG